MTWEKDNPYAIVDKESNPPVVVARYERLDQAEGHVSHLRDHGGAVLREKVERGGYGIDGPARETGTRPSPRPR